MGTSDRWTAERKGKLVDDKSKARSPEGVGFGVWAIGEKRARGVEKGTKLSVVHLHVASPWCSPDTYMML